MQKIAVVHEFYRRVPTPLGQMVEMWMGGCRFYFYHLITKRRERTFATTAERSFCLQPLMKKRCLRCDQSEFRLNVHRGIG